MSMSAQQKRQIEQDQQHQHLVDMHMAQYLAASRMTPLTEYDDDLEEYEACDLEEDDFDREQQLNSSSTHVVDYNQTQPGGGIKTRGS